MTMEELRIGSLFIRMPKMTGEPGGAAVCECTACDKVELFCHWEFLLFGFIKGWETNRDGRY